MINSHIQITKALLRNFSHKTSEGRKVFCLDVEKNIISEEKISKLDTELGYYSENVELFLNKYIENNTGEIFKIIRTFGNNPGKDISMIIDDKHQKDLKIFICYTYLRSEFRFEEEPDNSELMELKDISIGENGPLPINNFEFNVLGDYFITLLLNNSATDFVIPRNCFYFVEEDEINLKYVFPISPRIAVLVIKNSFKFKYMSENGDVLNQEFSENKIADYYNYKAMVVEKRFNNKFVVSKNMVELEHLMELKVI